MGELSSLPWWEKTGRKFGENSCGGNIIRVNKTSESLKVLRLVRLKHVYFLYNHSKNNLLARMDDMTISLQVERIVSMSKDILLYIIDSQ